METYNRDFADYYDRITAHKDYQAEVETLARYIREAVPHPKPRMLDLGCGTGHHAALLSDRGYDVTAIDLSPDMIRVAASNNAVVKFKTGDVAEMPESGFHFCYSLFNVVNCLESIEDLIALFEAVYARLANDGVFFVEAWNAVAVIAMPPEIVERTYEYEDQKIVRKVTPASDFLNQRLDLRYDVDVYSIESPPDKVKSFTVTHHLVLYTPLEIEYCLKQAGFGNISSYTALPEMAPATATDRMLAFACNK